MYLTQMGEIPLLSANEEIAARQEDRGDPQALPPQGAGVRLRPVERGRDAQARPHRRPALRPHRQGVAHREPRKGQDPPADAAQPARRSNTCWSRTSRTSTKSVDAAHADEDERRKLRRQPRASAAARPSTLVEELSIRTQKVQPLMKKLEQISIRMDELEQQIERPRQASAAARRIGPTWKKSCATWMMMTLEDPATPAQARRDRSSERFTEYEDAKRGSVRRQPAAGGVDRQEVPQPRPELPRPDPGRQHRPDAGGRQVRISPRLQVLAPTRHGGFARRSRGPSPTRPARSASRYT